MSFPVVTLCNNNVIYTRTEGEQALPEELQEFCNNTKQYDEAVKVLGNLSASEFQRYGANVEDFINGCDIEGVSCVDPKYWTASVPDTFAWGLCYSLDTSLFDKPSGLGIWNSISLELNLESDMYCGSISPDVGARMAVHEQGSWPNPNEGYTLASSSSYLVEIGLKRVIRLGEPYTACESEKIFYPSTEPCYEKCVVQEVLRQCECRFSRSLQYEELDLPFCDNDDTLETCGEGIEAAWFNEESDCECPLPACEATNYYIKSASAGRWPSRKARQIYSDEDMMNENDYVGASIYFSTFSHEENRETADKDIVSTLSTVGGSLGLCLGASIISLFEIAELLGILGRRWNIRRVQRKRERMLSMRKALLEEEGGVEGQEMEDNAN